MPPDGAECRAADTRHLYAPPITSTTMKANGSKRGARDGRSSFERSGRRIRYCVSAAADQCGSYRLAPIGRLSTRYSGTSGTSTPTRHLCVIILRLGSAGRLSGEPAAPGIRPRSSTRADRSVPGRGHRPSSCAHIFSQGGVTSHQKPAAARYARSSAFRRRPPGPSCAKWPRFCPIRRPRRLREILTQKRLPYIFKELLGTGTIPRLRELLEDRPDLRGKYHRGQ